MSLSPLVAASPLELCSFSSNMAMTSFDKLGLSAAAQQAVSKLGYESPTLIQNEAIPHVLAGKDLIAAANTGTGKTAAFMLPIMSQLANDASPSRAPRVLVITPTRELAEQIAHVSFKIGSACHHFTTVIFGGQPYSRQIKELRRGTDVLIATPGRLRDLIDRGVVDLSKIEVLVLDEADRMLDMGFGPAVKEIVDLTPRDRQTLLFSATIDSSIKNNLSDLLRDPLTIQIAERGETAHLIDQYVLPVEQKNKPELLKCLLDEKPFEKVIIFARTKMRAETVFHNLFEAGYDCECIHSDRTQGQRKHALSKFRSGKCSIIVATDVLARGIDVPLVDYVINYDLPDMAEDYIHRIGRTGRAGHAGFAVSFVSPNSLKSLQAIEALVNRTIPVMRMESYNLNMSLLHKHKRQKRVEQTSSKKHKQGRSHASRTAHTNAPHKAAHYNYEGWGDLRDGKKKRGERKGSGAQAQASKPSKHTASPKRRHTTKRDHFDELYSLSPSEKKARGSAAGKNKGNRRRNTKRR